jgi:uncharacterized protein (DUF697 family)
MRPASHGRQIEEKVMSPPDDSEGRLVSIKAAKKLIRHYSYWSGGFGLIPLPVIDIVAISGVQVKMLLEMAKHYPGETSANDERVRGAVGALIGGLAPVAIGGGLISAFKFVPGLGQIVGVLAVPALAAASTIAIGRVFLEHFESGGTLLDFEPEKMREYYMREFEAAKANPSGAVDAPLAAQQHGA